MPERRNPAEGRPPPQRACPARDEEVPRRGPAMVVRPGAALGAGRRARLLLLLLWGVVCVCVCVCVCVSLWHRASREARPSRRYLSVRCYGRTSL